LSFEWQWWPQAELPFDAAAREYIAALDADKDVAALAAHGLRVRPACLRVLRVCTMLLQKAAAAGLPPAQIAAVASRQAHGGGGSPLERMHAAAAALAPAAGGGGGACGDGVDEAAYLVHMGRLMDAHLEREFALGGGGAGGGLLL
jgi:hypothetical protein